MQQTSLSGANYLSNGFSLIWKPGIRIYVFIPLSINLLLLSIASVYAFNQIVEWYSSLQGNDNSIIHWFAINLEWLLLPVLTVTTLIVVFFLVAFIANWVAAPFNGLLSEAVEKHLSGNRVEQIFNLKTFLNDIPRLFSREFQKLGYYLPRAIGCLILFFTPLVFIAPFVWFFFNAWMAAIQYIDYPMDNNKIPFSSMLQQLKHDRSSTWSFGILVMFLTMIPLVNLLIMPVAVAGATNLWHDRYNHN